MTTTTSFSKKDRFIGLYKSTFRRSIGYFGLICALIAIFYPFQYVMEAFKTINPEQLASRAFTSGDPFYLYRFYGLGKNFTGVSAFFFTAVALLTPMILALVLGNYMHSKKAADVYHALPIKREMLLAVNAAVAMTYIAVPVIASNLIIALIQIAKFGFIPRAIGFLALDTVGWLIAAFCIYAVTTFVCVCVGTVFDAFVFSSTLLVSAPILCGLFLLLAQTFLFGFYTNDTIMMTIFNLSPVTVMPARFALEANYNSAGSTFNAEYLKYVFNSNLALIIYLVLAVALFAVSMKLYHNRHSETAETTTSKGILQIIIKFLGTIISGVCVGMIFYSINYPSDNMAYLVWTVIGGILAYAISEIILNRGFKTLLKSLPLGVCMVAITVGASLAIMYGGFGYENRIPSANQIKSVEINYMGRYNHYGNIQSVGPVTKTTVDGGEDRDYMSSINTVRLSDPQNLEAVRGFHSDVVSRKLKNGDGMDLEPESFVWSNTKLTYTLQDGRKLTRYYNGIGSNSLIELASLETSEEFVKQTHGAFFTDAKDIVDWTVSDMYGNQRLTQIYSAADSKILLEAIQADLAATTLESLLHPTQTAIATIRFTANLPEEGSDRCVSSAYFVVTEKSQKTYQLLEKKGLLENLKVDLSKCYAVTASLVNEKGYSGNSNSTIAQIDPDSNEFTYNELEDIKGRIEESRKYREESTAAYETSDGYAYAEKYGYDSMELFENPADIQSIASAMVGSYSSAEPLVYANFYFEDASRGTPVLVPLSSLPADMQNQFKLDQVK